MNVEWPILGTLDYKADVDGCKCLVATKGIPEGLRLILIEDGVEKDITADASEGLFLNVEGHTAMAWTFSYSQDGLPLRAVLDGEAVAFRARF